MQLLFRFSLVLFSGSLFAQSSCEVWQWLGSDSANKTLAKTITYNTKGQVTFEKMTGWVENPKYGAGDDERTYHYADTLLSTFYSVVHKDSFRIEREYDSNGKLVLYRSSMRDYIIEDTVQSGMFTTVRVSVDSNAGKWRNLSETRIIYDRWGREIQHEYKSPNQDWKVRNKWEYDQQGRRIKHEYFVVNGKIHWYCTYEYFEGGYKCIYTWYDENGKVVKPGKKSLQYQRKKISICRKDAHGRITEERNLDYKGKQIDRTTFSYNAQGKLVRDIYCGAADKAEITHSYEYR